jgi:large repetitive protein
VTAVAKAAKTGTHWRRIFALTVFGALMLAALAFANSGRAAIETPPPPSVWSDKADYAPGEQVTLSGANWAPGESVHIRVNDDAGQTWSRDVDVTADANGAISDQFNLPDWFVAVYSVTATGASSGTATWSFTDGNVTLHLEAAQGVANMTVTYDRWNGTSSSPNSTCSGPPTLTNLIVSIPAASGTVNITGFGGSTDSVRLKSVTTTTTTKTFDRWTSAVGTTGQDKNADSGVDVPGTPTPCISNDNGGSSGNLTDAFAHFKNANTAPVCNNGTATTNEDTSVATTLSCTDAQNNTLTYTIVSGPANGTLSGTAPNLSYSPNANYNGSDSFTFKANDGSLDSNVATFNITINAVNDAPTCTNGSATTNEDNAVATPLSCADVDSGSLTYTIVSGPSNGVLSGTGASRTYTPNANFNGSDSFTFKANDGSADSNVATFSLTVTEVNDAPSATNDSKSVAEDDTLSFPASDLTGNDSAGPANESGQTLTVTAVNSTASTNGTVSLVAGTVTYTPAANFHGPASFEYTVTDNGTTNGSADPNSATGTVNVTVTEVNDPPVAVDDEAEVAEDGDVAINVSGNDSAGPANESSQTLTVSITSAPASGSVVVLTTGPDAGKVKYTPDADYNGPDSFSYKVCDNGTTAGAADSLCDEADVDVTVTEVNDAPVADDDTATVAEDGNVLVDVLFNDSTGPANESDQTLSIDSVGSAAHGTTEIVSGEVKYTPAANYNGPDSFSYTAKDNGTTDGANDFKTDTATVNVTVTEVNDHPVAATDSLTVAEDGSVIVGTATLMANDSPGPANESGQTLTITAVGSATHGSVSLNGMTGEVTFTPDGDYNGPASFTYTVRDNGTTSGSPDYKTDTGTVNVTVTEVNDAPHAVNDSESVPEDSSTGVLVDVLANDGKGAANESGQTLTITFVGTPSHGTATLESGKIRYMPTESNYNGPDSFGYTITDNGTTNGVADPKSDSATVDITVTPVNDKPSVARDNASVTVNEGQTASNSGTYSDVDGDNVAISASVGTVSKTGVGNGTWSWSFNTTDGPAQSQTVTITANDGNGGTETTTFALTVDNVKPTITNVTATNTYAGPLAFMTSAISTFFTDPGADAPWANVLTFSDGGTESGSGSASPITLTHRFTTPGCKTVMSKITDKDGAFDNFGPTPVNVGTGEFLPPVTNTPVTNKLKNGQVLPVKVKLTDCNGAPVTGLNPAIALKKGDLTSVGDDSVVAITPGSVSNADTTGIMRSNGDGSYIYNMSVSIALNTDYTLIVYPFGLGSPTQYLAHVIQATK